MSLSCKRQVASYCHKSHVVSPLLPDPDKTLSLGGCVFSDSALFAVTLLLSNLTEGTRPQVSPYSFIQLSNSISSFESALGTNPISFKVSINESYSDMIVALHNTRTRTS